MKKLISLLFSGMLAITPIVSQESQRDIFKKLGIPRRFIGYERFFTGAGITELNDDFLVHIIYDINGDEKADVMEYHNISSISEGNPIIFEDEVIAYWFDLNNNDKRDGEELFWDYHKDGLNGNEERTSIWGD